MSRRRGLASHRRIVAGALGLGLGLATLACRRAPAVPEGWTTAESLAFRARHDAALASPTGPLSTVASYYVGAGQVLALGLVDGSVVRDPPDDARRVRLERVASEVRCLEGCQGSTSLELPALVPLGRFSLGASLQAQSLRVLVHDPEAAARRATVGPAWFPVDPRVIVPARWEADPEHPSVELSTSRGASKTFARAGSLHARLGDEDITLWGYQSGSAGALLVPFTDATTGVETYPVGRYLEVSIPDSGPAVLDFNRATNPWCAYSEHYNCPVPPPGNQLPVRVAAGEMLYLAP